MPINFIFYRNHDFSLILNVVDYILVLGVFCLHCCNFDGHPDGHRFIYLIIIYIYFIFFKLYIFLDLDFSQLYILNGLKIV